MEKNPRICASENKFFNAEKKPIDIKYLWGHHKGYEDLSNEARKLLTLREDISWNVKGDKVDFIRIGNKFFAKAIARVSSAPWNPKAQFFEIRNAEIIAKLKAIEKEIVLIGKAKKRK